MTQTGQVFSRSEPLVNITGIRFHCDTTELTVGGFNFGNSFLASPNASATGTKVLTTQLRTGRGVTFQSGTTENNLTASAIPELDHLTSIICGTNTAE